MTKTGFETLFLNAFGAPPEAAGYAVEETAVGEWAAKKGDQVVELEVYGGRIMGWNVNGERHADFTIHPRDEVQAADRRTALEAR